MRFASMLLLFLFNFAAFAQDPCPPGNDCGPPNPPGEAPIDDYLLIFLLIGLCYGGFVIYKTVQKREGIKS